MSSAPAPSPFRLGVLDQSPIRAGATPADAVRETLELADLAEKLGYHRYWLAEHHNSGGLAGAAPEILIGHVAARTKAMRVGSGGVMLSHYAPLKVAETFRMLSMLHPGRIDLGLGRAPGSDQATAQALAYGHALLPIEAFPHQLADVVNFLGDGFAPDHPFAAIRAMPEGAPMPELWLLGSSDQSAAYAAHFGFRFSFAQFIAGVSGAEVAGAYRAHFQPSAHTPAPEVSLGISVLVAETEAEAKRLGASRDLWLVRLAQGQREPFPSAEEAASYPYRPRERAYLEANRGRSVVGAPEQVRDRLMALAAEYGAQEVIAVTITHDPAARRRSYRLLAEACGLKPRA